METCGLDGCLGGGRWIDAGGTLGTVHWSCFVAADLRLEALEVEFAAGGAALADLQQETEPLLPARRDAFRDLTGVRLGRLRVLSQAGYRRRGSRGWTLRMWLVVCDCGRRNELEDGYLRGKNAPRECRYCANRHRASGRIRTIGGLTLSELARRAGVTPDAIRKRARRGQSLEGPGRRSA